MYEDYELCRCEQCLGLAPVDSDPDLESWERVVEDAMADQAERDEAGTFVHGISEVPL